MMTFQYDVLTLLELVEARPCLWDKTNEGSKNKILREKSWQEIVSFLETGYEEMSKNEKKRTGDVIVKKWANIRDSFMKSLRTNTGQGFQKKYIYADHLNFLLKVVEKADTESNFNETEFSSVEIPHSAASAANTPELRPFTPEPNELPPPVLPPLHKKKKREPDVIEREILAELKNQARVPAPLSSMRDEKQTMLLSFLPYIKDMNETEMMDLHMEILTSIRKIKQKRALNIRIYTRPSSSLPSSSSTSSANYVYSTQLPFISVADAQPTVPNSQQVLNDINNQNSKQYSSVQANENALHATINPQPTENATNVNGFEDLFDELSTEE